jgi:hypothetical protein
LESEAFHTSLHSNIYLKKYELVVELRLFLAPEAKFLILISEKRANI